MIVNNEIKDNYFLFLDMKDRKGSVRESKNAVNQFLNFLEILAISLTKIDYKAIKKYVNFLIEEKGYASKTVHQRVSLVKTFLRYSFDEQYINTHVDRLFTSQIKSLLPKVEKKAFFELEEEEMENLIQKCKNQHRALILILYNTMGRVSAIEKVKLFDIDYEKNRLVIYEDKIKAELPIELSDRTVDAIKEYIEKYRKEPNEKHREHLFITNKGTNLKARSIQMIIAKYRHLVGGKLLTPHSFRHVGITHMLENGASIQDVAVIVGHRSINTTMHYYLQSRKNRAKTFKKSHPLLREKHLSEKEKIIDEKDLKVARAKQRLMNELSKLQNELNEV